MPVAATAKFMSSPAAKADHIYIDTDNHIRDLFVENMFSHLFYGKPITDTFKHNFQLYFHTCFESDEEPLPNELFEDSAYAVNFVRVYLGLCHVATFDGDEDEAFEHCTHTAILRGAYCGDDNVIRTHGPNALYAVLLTIVTSMRWVCDQTFKRHAEEEAEDANSPEHN